MMEKRRFFVSQGVLLAVLMAATSCGSSSSGTTTTTTDTSSTVPSDIVVSSPTASTSGSTSITVKSVTKAGKPGDADADDYASKREALQTLIAGSGECSFTLEIPTITDVNCYGPNIDFVVHPNATQPDGNTTDDGMEDDDGFLPGGDTGIWNPTQGTQACAAAKMNELVGKVASKVDNMISIFGAMACAGKKAGVALPAAGAEVDLTSAFNDNVTIGNLTISSAKLSRLANDGDGNTVYQSTIEMSITVGQSTQTGKIVLKHIPTTSDNSTYKGKVLMSMSNATNSVNCTMAGGNTGLTDAGSILYEKTSSTAVKYELNFASFCGTSYDVSNGLDPTDKVSSSNKDGWADNWNYGLFSLNPTNGVGSVAYAWQAGSADQRTRVLDVATTADSDGAVSGDAYFGFGPDIATSAGRGTINGFVCNWAGPSGAISLMDRSSAGQQLAQHQAISRASGASEFTATNSEIRYAITNSCNADAGGSFTYQAVADQQSKTPLNMANDRTSTASAVTNNLVDLSAVTFTKPTAPSDV
ncbi:MAG: hypothetical protein HY540_04645 [Deltaproteobacteria bacterium]|nr:hypothetical protein [Deltaproteobacteria bacterium]